MNLTLDNLLVAATVLGALAFFVIRYWRARKKGCASGCCDVGKRGTIKRS